MSVAGAVAWPVRAVRTGHTGHTGHTTWRPRRRRADADPARAAGVAGMLAALREALNTPEAEDTAGDLTASGNHSLSLIGGGTVPRGHRALQPGDGPSLADLYYAH